MNSNNLLELHSYSSLAYLAKLPVNALKIDRSFVATMTSDAQSMTLVSTIISLAHALDLKVIAEGVESQEQAKLLRLLKCDEMQGFLFGRPLPAEEVQEFLRGSQNRTVAKEPQGNRDDCHGSICANNS